MQPIFLLSLPRSGSTLAQRILAAHPDIATASEPWLLLPLVSAFRDDLGVAEYGHRQAVGAVAEFLDGVTGGEEHARRLLRDAVLGIYQIASDGRPFFLDKTPRYHLIVESIMELFPDAKYLFVWRNPLAIAASMVNTWSVNGRWNLHRYKVDLFKGLVNLIKAAQTHPGPNTYAIRYEDMVLQPERTWQAVFEFLGLEFDPHVLHAFQDVHLAGRMGDPTGTRKYRTISRASLDTWSDVYVNPLRRRWGHAYLDWIGPEQLAFLGYDPGELGARLNANRKRFEHLPDDAFFMTWGAAHALFDLPGLRVRWRTVTRGHRVYPRT